MHDIDIRAMPPPVQADIRRKAVRAVLSGRCRTDVARLLNVRRETVGAWVKNYRARGVTALKTGAIGRPRGGALAPWQAAEIARSLTDSNPEQLKLPFYLWTRQSVAMLIQKRFGKRLSKWTVGRYLARWGFTAQKPVRRAYEQNSEAVRNVAAATLPGDSPRGPASECHGILGRRDGIALRS